MGLYSVLRFMILLLVPNWLQAVITMPPVDTQGLLNTISTFYCEGNGSLLKWTVDGTDINDNVTEERGINISKWKPSVFEVASEFHIKAIPINNNINIGCGVATASRVYSKAARFQVLGISPVNNLQFAISNSLLVAMWDPPSYSSEDNYNYNIIVYKKSMYVLVNETVQDLEYILEMEACNLYTINISAVSVSYKSTPEMKQHFYGQNKFTITRTLVIFKDMDHCDVHIEVEMYTNFSKLCSGTITSTARSINPFKSHPIKKISHEFMGANINLTKYNFTTGFFDNGLKGILTVEFMDKNNVVSRKLHFNTYHVQDLKVSDLSNGLVSVTCVFAKGSLADGCLVEFIREEYINPYKHRMNKTSGIDSVTECIAIPNGIYHTVGVYDIVNGTSSERISKTVDFELIVDISIIPTITSSYLQTFTTTTSPTVTMNSPTVIASDQTRLIVPIAIGIIFGVVVLTIPLVVFALVRRRLVNNCDDNLHCGMMGRKPQTNADLMYV